jgi:glycosyltransferase involved in cell wall biosynthesis
MKLVLVFRKQRSDAFSIEELFRTIACELRKQIEVIEYELGERSDFFQDLRELWALKADIYHVTGDVNYLVPMLPRGRTVLTVHDIGHYLVGLSGIKRLIYKWLWLVWPINTAAAVTCVSEETQRNICEHLKVPSERLVVIQNCYSTLFQPVSKVFNSARPTILQVGTKSYKNVNRLARSLKGISCRLVLIGKIDLELAAALSDAKIDHVNHVNLTHKELVREYIACDLVTFVSIGEGFGVPIIEAQAVGRPLVTSDVSPLREVAGPGACLVAPLSEESICAGIRHVIDDPIYRADLVARGLVNAQRFSASSVAERYMAVYKRLLPADGLKTPAFELGSSQ